MLAHAPREVVTVSSDLKQHLVAEGFPAGKVSVIHNGIEIGPLPGGDLRAQLRRELGIADHEVVVGTVARLDPVKDLHTLIRAIGLQPPGRAPMTLLVIGDGDERASLEAAARDIGAGSIRFLGHREDARDLLAGCDLFANSSISEGISLTILEAMAAGLPVVATRVGGTPEIVDATAAGWCRRATRQALAEALASLRRRSGSAATRSGATARARVEQHFTLDRMVREYRDAYYARRPDSGMQACAASAACSR